MHTLHGFFNERPTLLKLLHMELVCPHILSDAQYQGLRCNMHLVVRVIGRVSRVISGINNIVLGLLGLLRVISGINNIVLGLSGLLRVISGINNIVLGLLGLLRLPFEYQHILCEVHRG